MSAPECTCELWGFCWPCREKVSGRGGIRSDESRRDMRTQRPSPDAKKGGEVSDEKLRAALEQIRDLEPEWSAWEHPDPKCFECAAVKKKKWPPSGLCSHHYSLFARHQDQMAKNRNLTTEMRQIAREALWEVDQ